jgi:hypothetical protein
MASLASLTSLGGGGSRSSFGSKPNGGGGLTSLTSIGGGGGGGGGGGRNDQNRNDQMRNDQTSGGQGGKGGKGNGGGGGPGSDSSGPGPGGGGQGDSIILEEEIDPNYEPTQDEVVEYAKWLGMDMVEDKDLMWIAREGLKAPLPENWKPCKTTDTDEIYYFNFSTGDSTWDHPCDEYYRSVYEEEKKKRNSEPRDEAKKKKKNKEKEVMRMHACPHRVHRPHRPHRPHHLHYDPRCASSLILNLSFVWRRCFRRSPLATASFESLSPRFHPVPLAGECLSSVVGQDFSNLIVPHRIADSVRLPSPSSLIVIAPQLTRFTGRARIDTKPEGGRGTEDVSAEQSRQEAAGEAQARRRRRRRRRQSAVPPLVER